MMATTPEGFVAELRAALEGAIADGSWPGEYLATIEEAAGVAREGLDQYEPLRGILRADAPAAPDVRRIDPADLGSTLIARA